MLRVGNPGASGSIAFGDDQGCFKQLFELSPDPTWIIEGNRFVECNVATIKALGYPSRDELLNVHPSKLSPPTQPDGEDSYTKAERMIALAKDKGLHRFEWTHTKADGINFVAEVTLSAIELSGRKVIYCVWRDITERKQAETALHSSELQFRATFEQAAVGISHVALDGRWLRVNQKLCDITGRTREELLALRYQDITHPDDLPNNAELERHLLTEEVPTYSIEKRYLHKSGRIVWVKPTVSVVNKVSGEPDYFISVIQDITERKRTEEALHESEARFRSLTEMSSDWYWEQDRELRLSYHSSGFSQFSGTTSDKLLGKRRWEEPNRFPLSGTWEEHRATLEAHEHFQGFEYVRIGADGEQYFVSLSGAPICDKAGKFNGYRGIGTNITERKQMEDQIRQLAFYDPLTELPNRRLLLDRLSQSLAESKRSGRYGALMFLDLDNFKALNDTAGHAVGDLLLMQAAKRMKSCVREVDTVARLGGDEFVVMMGDLDEDKAASSAQASKIAEKIRSVMAEPYLLAVEHDAQADTLVEHHCTASLGLVVFIEHGGTQDDFLRLADTAMYQAKNAGGNLIWLIEAKC